MNEKPHLAITLTMLRERVYSAVVLDSLDAVGLSRQSPRVPLVARGRYLGPLVGRCKTTLWADMFHHDADPYALELQAVDTCRTDDVLIAAAGGSLRSGIWGELLSTAVRNQGCVGAIVDGAVRDVHAMRAMGFPVFSRGTSPYDSRDRQRVIDVDVPVEIDGVLFSPGDLVIADDDGVVVVPQAVEEVVIGRAWEKINAEDTVRDAIRKGMTAAEAFRKYGVL